MAGRILNYVLLFVLGLLVGAVGTVAHQSTVSILGVDVPWGVVAGILAVACLLIGLRLINRSRWQAVAAAIGILVSIGVLSLPSEGGSVLMPANVLGNVWVYTPIIIAAIVVAWPRLPERGGVNQNGIS
jgi:sulfite exporter TauE/SafE